jgi:hypothetical protein
MASGYGAGDNVLQYPVTGERWIVRMPMDNERLSTTEAVCRLMWHLMHGESMTTHQAAELIGYPDRGARMMLCRMSRYLPLYQDDGGFWIVEYGDVL